MVVTDLTLYAQKKIVPSLYRVIRSVTYCSAALRHQFYTKLNKAIKEQDKKVKKKKKGNTFVSKSVTSSAFPLQLYSISHLWLQTLSPSLYPSTPNAKPPNHINSQIFHAHDRDHFLPIRVCSLTQGFRTLGFLQLAKQPLSTKIANFPD